MSVLALPLSIVLLAASPPAQTSPAEPTRGTVRYLANEGVLVQAGARRVAVDFPFTGEFDWCVSPTQEQVQALLDGVEPFESVDLLLFTHDHVDHFDPALTVRALRAHPEAALVGTSLVVRRVREAEGGSALPNPLYEATPGRAVEWRGVEVLPLVAPHARYWDIDRATGKTVILDDGYVHVAYRVEMSGFSFVHGGDAYHVVYPSSCSADLLLLDRGVLRGLGFPALPELHRRLGARRTVLMHLGPAEASTLPPRIADEAAWLSALSERDQVVRIP